MEIRRAQENDIPGIAALERECFSDPWSEKSLKETPGTMMLVATDNECITGYIITRCVAGEAELFRICVKGEARRKGTGQMLLESGIEAAKAEGAKRLFLEVRSKNAPARGLYIKAGFKETGLRRDYYTDPQDDAVIMMMEFETGRRTDA